MRSGWREGWGANAYCYPYTTGMRGECEPGAVFACAIFLGGYINAERDMLCRLLYDYIRCAKDGLAHRSSTKYTKPNVNDSIARVWVE